MPVAAILEGRSVGQTGLVQKALFEHFCRHPLKTLPPTATIPGVLRESVQKLSNPSENQYGQEATKPEAGQEFAGEHPAPSTALPAPEPLG